MLEKVNLGLTLSKEEYRSVLPGLQQRLYDLEKACWDQNVASILVFEGWDAAGKGSAIATLTERLDPRGYKLHPITPPRTYEQQRPWLWRFWLRTPNYGEMAIFDRSWYRRVLEKRVEQAIPKKEVGNAFRDIVEFEQMLADDGTVIVKFWLHISKKEQKARFKALEKDPLESWRVTKEDWARHRRYEGYLDAAEEMLARTESEWGPWTIVESTSRWYSRRKIFETVIRALEAKLGGAAPAARSPTDNGREATKTVQSRPKKRGRKGAR
jgi:polyphosphate kinase 2 (PPK2 family)